ncbi:hypothetical protein JCM16358_00150 [Halanaerocella petrolearia]
MKIALIVEGTSDKIIFKKLRDWFEDKGLEIVNIINANGKSNMYKKAHDHYEVCKYVYQVDYMIFIPDLDNDSEEEIKDKLDFDDEICRTSILIKSLEAWILADGQCIRDSLNINYSPSGMTDVINNPKQRLFNLYKGKKDYVPTEVEAANFFASNFSIERAVNKNNSVLSFKRLIKNIIT